MAHYPAYYCTLRLRVDLLFIFDTVIVNFIDHLPILLKQNMPFGYYVNVIIYVLTDTDAHIQLKLTLCFATDFRHRHKKTQIIVVVADSKRGTIGSII